MACSLSATLVSNSLHLNRITSHCCLHLHHPTLSLHQNLPIYSKNLPKLLTTQNHATTTPFASGTAGVESPVLSDDTTSSLDSVKVFDLEGNGIPISDLWKDRKAVVAFARHFGCVLCRKRADYLASKKDIMDASGVALVLIGPGSIDQAKSFAEKTKFQGEIYADPTHSSYEALQFVSGVLTTFTPNAGLKIIQLYREGYRQDWKLSFEKDTVTRGGWKQGGIIVAGPGKNNISYLHKDKEAGDDPEIEDILKACCS
ncbi:thioredoxin-like protein AAED1, chloroplastic isoform X2 [Vigna radiata var. radiata]|uniref:Thioredoxin-like protein AAED1, chloroplastic isoform X2 n=1 Tax=Vigna radiata var. radiata TaxID=3916 RepID=A0A1S3TPY8_VIGRR|nr:thioredoxin-like protein AAED1, chloroplastic isoform X2 [Vigna radiata var. radiata]